MSCWELEISHDGSIYTLEISKYYKSDSPHLPTPKACYQTFTSTALTLRYQVSKISLYPEEPIRIPLLFSYMHIHNVCL